MSRIIILGGGVAGAEAGTLIGTHADSHITIIEIECDPARKFGGWGFQEFPITEHTNLALRKMYLGENENEIINWAQSPENRSDWPDEFKNLELQKDSIFPRVLMKKYVEWRRNQVSNPLVTYESICGEGVAVTVVEDAGEVQVTLSSGEVITGDRLVMASGSISVKIPSYLEHLAGHRRVIMDPLVREGHEQRAIIPKHVRTLVLGTGLTGEEQVNILLHAGHRNVTLLSREGRRHYAYPRAQTNKPLVLDRRPEFLLAETPEEFAEELNFFYAAHLANGHTHEDILAAVRPHWEGLRKSLGGCEQAVKRIGRFKRSLAVSSIGISYESAANTDIALSDGRLAVLSGHITAVREKDGEFVVEASESRGGPVSSITSYDYIINAVGRNIIRHPVWQQMMVDGLATKHASIGVQVNEHGQMLRRDGSFSSQIYVVGMPRAGDHAFRHGYLGNTAFNVPQIRTHVASTMLALLKKLRR